MTPNTLLSEVQRLVIEPTIDGGLTWPSGLWTRLEVLAYLNQRQNQYVKESQIIVGTNILAVSAGQGQVDLPEDWVATVSVSYRRMVGIVPTFTPVYPMEATQADYGFPDWMTMSSPVPLGWTDGETDMASLRLIPPPTVDGHVYLVYIPLAEELTEAQLVAGTGLLDVPDDFCVFLRYGVLADMFGKQGRGFDPIRMEACEARFREGIDLAKGVIKGWL